MNAALVNGDPVLVPVEVTDLIFAVDSIPAICAVTSDPFIVFTSNIFAILGLRAMYFLLADMADGFHLLKYGLAFILVFIGVKMLLLDFYKIPIGIALGIVGAILAMTGCSLPSSPFQIKEGGRAEEDAQIGSQSLAGLAPEGRVGVSTAGMRSPSLQGRIYGAPRQTPPGPGFQEFSGKAKLRNKPKFST